MNQEQSVVESRQKSTPVWQTVLKIVVSLGLMAVILQMVDLGTMKDVFRRADWLMLFAGFAIFIAAQIMRAIRWHILVACHAPDVPMKSTINALFVGLFFNMFLPAELGGDVVRGIWLDKKVGSRSATFASVLADRVMGMLTMASMGLLALVMGATAMSRTALLMVLGLCIVLLLFTAIVASKRIADFFINLPIIPRRFDLAARLQRFTEAIRLYRSKHRAIAWSIVWSFFFQGAVYISYYTLAIALGFHCPLWSFFVFIPLITIMTMVPASLNGIGAREVGYALFFAQVGLSREHAVSLSLASYAFLVAISLLGGLVYLLQKRRG